MYKELHGFPFFISSCTYHVYNRNKNLKLSDTADSLIAYNYKGQSPGGLISSDQSLGCLFGGFSTKRVSFLLMLHIPSFYDSMSLQMSIHEVVASLKRSPFLTNRIYICMQFMSQTHSSELRQHFIVFFVQICIQDSGCSVHKRTKIFNSMEGP